MAQSAFWLRLLLLLLPQKVDSSAVHSGSLGRSLSSFRPLHGPALSGDSAALKRALEAGGNFPDAVDGFQRTPLHHAATAGHVTAASLLLDARALVDAKDAGLASPLHCASAEGHVDVVNLLLDRGAADDLEDALGRSPLHTAIVYGHVKTVEMLLDGGADLNATGPWGWGTLHFTASSTANSLSTAELLLSRGASADIADEWGQTPLQLAARHQQTALARLLMKRGAAADHEDSWGSGPIFAAAKSGDEEVVTSLLVSRALADSRDGAGVSPLHGAAGSGHDGATLQLLVAGASPQAVDTAGRTPLHLSVREGHTAAVSALLAHGADVTATDGKGEAPFDVVPKGQEQHIIKLLAKALAEHQTLIQKLRALHGAEEPSKRQAANPFVQQTSEPESSAHSPESSAHSPSEAKPLESLPWRESASAVSTDDRWRGNPFVDKDGNPIYTGPMSEFSVWFHTQRNPFLEDEVGVSADPRLGTNPFLLRIPGDEWIPFPDEKSLRRRDDTQVDDVPLSAAEPTSQPWAQARSADPRSFSNPAAGESKEEPQRIARSVDPRIGTNPFAGAEPNVEPWRNARSPGGVPEAIARQSRSSDPQVSDTLTSPNAEPISADPRVGTNPFLGVEPISADPRVGTNPFLGVEPISADPRVGTNPFQGAVLTSPDPRVGTNPFQGVELTSPDPRIGTNPFVGVQQSGFATRLADKARSAVAASKASWFESNPFLEVSEASSAASMEGSQTGTESPEPPRAESDIVAAIMEGSQTGSESPEPSRAEPDIVEKSKSDAQSSEGTKSKKKKKKKKKNSG